MKKLWDRLFLGERPSIWLSFFRIAVALTVGFHVLPTFCHLDDNYFHTAFKTLNWNFFTSATLDLVQKSPDWVVLIFVTVFCIFWFFFLIGLWSQLSCLLMVVASYYFYALNAFHVGTLSWDILLVTLFLMCLTPFHGDYFSVDSLLHPDEEAYKKRRPYFIQRLLQMQIAFTYFYTGLYKITAEGNWIRENPLYYLMNYPPEGTTKYFILRDFLYDKPQLCYALGILIITVELLMPFLLFCRRTRLSAIYLGMVFHVALILTLDVPAIFFFLFPAQLLLFINSDHIVQWIDGKRRYNQTAPMQSRLVYDGNCQFCRHSVQLIKVMDLFATLKLVNFQEAALHPEGKDEGMRVIHPQLTYQKAMSQLYLIEPEGTLYGGFDVFRRICFTMPMLYPMIFIFYFPGMGIVGPFIYKMVARNRYLFHFNRTCQNNACYR